VLETIVAEVKSGLCSFTEDCIVSHNKVTDAVLGLKKGKAMALMGSPILMKFGMTTHIGPLQRTDH